MLGCTHRIDPSTGRKRRYCSTECRTALERGMQCNTQTGKHCAHCQRQGSPGFLFKVCAGCNDTRYCGRDCQKADWKAGHKAVCKGQ